MEKIKIDFCDFNPNFSKTDNFLYKLLSEKYNIEICDQPDFLIFSNYGHAHRLHSGVKIFFSKESDFPKYQYCDYSIGPIWLNQPNHLDLSHYVLYGEPSEIIKKNDDHKKIILEKTKFCSFLVNSYNWRGKKSNKNRVDFFKKLCSYKKVDSAGGKFNNIGAPLSGGSRGKINFLRNYKFNIAFENRSLVGYTTEKIFEPMVSRCLPIYWGNPDINKEFNPKSFLNLSDFASDDDLINKIIELDNDDNKYMEYMQQPYFYNDIPNRQFDQNRIYAFFDLIFRTRIKPVARSANKFLRFGRWIPVKRYRFHPANPSSWS